MIKSVIGKMLVVSIIASVSLVACGDSDEKPGKSAKASAADALLSYVPADSPYVFASVAPLPEKVMDKLEPQLDRILQSYEVVLQEIVAMATAKAKMENADQEDAEKAIAVIGELSSLMSVEGLRNAGFELNSRGVLYGNGVLPVLRVEIADSAMFEAALKRMEESAGEQMDVATISGSPVRYVVADAVKILVLILDKQLVVSAAPVSFTDQQLSVLLGLTAPESSILKSGVLGDISSKYGYDYFVGFIDFTRIAATLTGSAAGLDADLLAMSGHSDALSDVCRSEIREVVAIAPRMVVGYTKVNTERADTQAIVELRADIAAGLKLWPAAVPGLGTDPGGLMSFGFSADLLAVRKFYETQLNALDADPFECEALAELQLGFSQGRAALQQPAPPMVYDFRGFVGVIENIEGLDMATQTPPTSVDGQFLLAMKNAPALVTMGTMMSPELAALNLQADEKPVKLDMPQAQMLGGDVYLAMNDDALAFSIGDGAQAKLGDLFSADVKENGTVMSFSMDAARYYAFMADAIATAERSDDDPMSAKFQAAMQDAMLAIGELYERMTVDFRLTDAGIVIDSAVTFGD